MFVIKGPTNLRLRRPLLYPIELLALEKIVPLKRDEKQTLNINIKININIGLTICMYFDFQVCIETNTQKFVNLMELLHLVNLKQGSRGKVQRSLLSGLICSQKEKSLIFQHMSWLTTKNFFQVRKPGYGSIYSFFTSNQAYFTKTI